MSESNGTALLDRMEKLVEVILDVQHDIQQEHKLLLRAQVVMTDQMEKLIKENNQRSAETNQRFADLAAAQQRMDDAHTALMGTVDEIVRSRKL
jgi:leucyl aminopeptidase (aminopeptidase T)